jgi:hypothetical protein
MKKVFDVDDDHSPDETAKGQWIGVEIECFIPYEQLGVRGEYAATSKMAELLEKHDIPNVSIKGDGSISSPDSGTHFETEIAILFKRKNKAPLKRLCALLKSLKTNVNRSCGLHVHLDCRDLFDIHIRYGDKLPDNVHRRGESIENVLPLMLKMVTKSRRDNEYCSPKMSHTDRTAINLTSFYKHKTIEVRLHQGSTNYEKISMWVDFLYRISRSKKSMRVSTVPQLKRYLGRDYKRIAKYAQKRVKALKEAA